MTVVSDYAEERTAGIRARNAENKRRGKEMERRVMKFLKGNRVPMSGSGSIKGDGQIFSKFGYILVECKCSTAVNAAGEQRLRVDFRWLQKMEIEAKIMNARFPVLIIHHQGAKQDYVIVAAEYFWPRCGDVMSGEPVRIIDLREDNGWTATRHKLELDFTPYTNYTILQTALGDYVVLTLRRFGELLEEDVDA